MHSVVRPSVRSVGRWFVVGVVLVLVSAAPCAALPNSGIRIPVLFTPARVYLFFTPWKKNLFLLSLRANPMLLLLLLLLLLLSAQSDPTATPSK